MAVLGTLGPRRTKRGLLWIAALALATCAGFGKSAQTAPALEYKIEAVFLFNFAQFVEWPVDSFANPQAPLIIGVLGDDPFGNYLDEAVRGEKVHNRPLVVERYHRVEDAKNSQILYISQSESDRLGQIFAALGAKSILTVGDSDGFAQSGGMIRFLNEKNHIRLRIDLEAAKAADLTLSSKLLRPAEIVTHVKN